MGTISSRQCYRRVDDFVARPFHRPIFFLALARVPSDGACPFLYRHHYLPFLRARHIVHAACELYRHYLMLLHHSRRRYGIYYHHTISSAGATRRY